MANPLGNAPQINNSPTNNFINSPFMRLFQQIQHGANPQMIVEQMVQSNPRIAQQVNMLKGQNNNMSYKDLAINIMRQRGIDPEQVMAMFGNSSQAK